MQVIESRVDGQLSPVPFFISSVIFLAIAVFFILLKTRRPKMRDYNVKACYNFFTFAMFCAIVLAIVGFGCLANNPRVQSDPHAVETYQKKGTLTGSATVSNVDNHNLSVVQENVTHDAPKISDNLRNSIIDDPKFRPTADILNDYIPLSMREQIKPNDKLTFNVVDSKLISLSIDRPVENNNDVQHIVLK